MIEGYGQWAEVYRRNGWDSVLPLPPRKKTPPPGGWTGQKVPAGKAPDDTQIAEWVRTRASGNLCLRMPPGVIGIDVDDYEYTHQAKDPDTGELLYDNDGQPVMATGVKTGNITLAELEDELGELPATWRSSSRGDGPSGIRFYQVPSGLLWGDFGEHLEGIWWGHRYAVAWPSVNPDSGMRYLWIDETETGDHEWGAPPPNVADLPKLPDAWIKRFGREPNAPKQPAPVADGPATERFVGSDRARQYTREQALDFVKPALADLRTAGGGTINNKLNAAAKTLSHFGPEFWSRHRAELMLYDALDSTIYDGKTWLAQDTINSAFDSAAADWRAELVSQPTGWTARTQVALRVPEGLPVADGAPDTPAPPEAAGFWDARPALRYVHDYAIAHARNPWGVLGALLARVIAMTEPNIQLPGAPIAVGTEASLNLFVALVGRSGGGKTVTSKVARKLLDARYGQNPVDLFEAPLGSGEGLAHVYMKPPEKLPKSRKTDDDSEMIGLGGSSAGPIQHRTRALIKALEIDSLDAIGQRRGSTLSAQLRTAWDADELGFHYAAADKRLPVPEHRYRMCLLLGVQPARAQGLMDQADGGLPQRFLWVPVSNPDLPEYDELAEEESDGSDLEIPPLAWQPPVYLGERVLFGECWTVRHAVKRNQRKVDRGEADALDAHGMLTRLKVAAGLAMLLGEQLPAQTLIDEETWELSGALMAISDHTRAQVQRELAEQAKLENEKRAFAEARKTITVEETKDRDGMQRALRFVRSKVGTDWVTERKLVQDGRRVREWVRDALAELVTTGELESEEYRSGTKSGIHYRRRNGNG